MTLPVRQETDAAAELLAGRILVTLGSHSPKEPQAMCFKPLIQSPRLRLHVMNHCGGMKQVQNWEAESLESRLHL